MWRNTFVLVLIFVSLAYSASASDQMAPSQFYNYKVVKINDHPLLLDPQLKYQMLKNDPEDEAFGWEFGAQLARIACDKFTVTIGFSYGPSDDPNYEIVASTGKKVFAKNVGAQSLAMSSACQFYASGEADNTFNMRQKFTITEKGIVEIPQPFYLVDKVCKTSAAATLRTKQCGKGSVVAHLPKDTEVRILLSEWFITDENDMKQTNCDGWTESYLVSTPFGLVGWVETTKGTLAGSSGVPLSCIIYHGD